MGRVGPAPIAVSLPVVASAVGWLLELIVDGQTGWLVPLGDPGALAHRLRALLLSPEFRRALGSAGRDRAAALLDGTNGQRDYADL